MHATASCMTLHHACNCIMLALSIVPCPIVVWWHAAAYCIQLGMHQDGVLHSSTHTPHTRDQVIRGFYFFCKFNCAKFRDHSISSNPLYYQSGSMWHKVSRWWTNLTTPMKQWMIMTGKGQCHQCGIISEPLVAHYFCKASASLVCDEHCSKDQFCKASASLVCDEHSQP